MKLFVKQPTFLCQIKREKVNFIYSKCRVDEESYGGGSSSPPGVESVPAGIPSSSKLSTLSQSNETAQEQETQKLANLLSPNLIIPLGSQAPLLLTGAQALLGRVELDCPTARCTECM